MLTLAYSSNMDLDEIKIYCPSAQHLFDAMLPGYKFGFTRRSQTRGCGVMDIVRCQGAEVWGVIYHIDHQDIAALNSKEGYYPERAKKAYQPINVVVLVCGDVSRSLRVEIFEVTRKADHHIPPNDHYKGLILKGARRWGLPDHYIRLLENIETE